MAVIAECLLLLGGITVFLVGLKFISSSTEQFVGEKLKKIMSSITKNRFASCGIGTLATALAQSSVATNIVAISFVNKGAISLVSACAMVIGTNIGTTMTAQLVSLKYVGSFNVTAIGSLIAFIGFVLGLSSKEKYRNIGNIALGFGMIFIGIEIMSGGIEKFKNYEWFKNLFLIKSPAILLLNGFFITAIFQSSSVITSMLVVLGGNGLISFSASAYLIMGSNIGTCLAVILVSGKKNAESKIVAWFNIIFNIFGVTLFILLISLSRGELLNSFKMTSNSITGQIANFHSFFNLIVGVVAMPILKPLVNLTTRLVLGKDSQKHLNQPNFIMNSSKIGNNKQKITNTH